MPEAPRASRPAGLWNRFFIIVCAANLFSNFCQQCYNAVKSLYVVDIGAATSFIGLLSLIGLICTTSMRIVSGRLSDAVNKRIVVISGTCVYMIAMLGFAFNRNLNVLIFFSACQSIGFSISATALSVVAADVIPRARLSEGIGYFGLANSVASAAGPGVALALKDAAGFQVVFISLAVYLALSIVSILLCRYERHPMIMAMREQDQAALAADAKASPAAFAPAKGIRKFIEPSAVPCAVLCALFMCPMGFVVQYLTLYASENGIANVALFFTFSAVSMVVARLLVGKLADRFGTLVVVAPAIVLYIAAFFLILTAPGAPGFVILVAGALYGLATGIVQPSLNAVVLKQVPAERRGAASGTFMISFDVGIAGGGAVWGLTIQHMGYAPTLYICLALAVIALALAFVILGRFGRKKQAAAQ